MQSLGLELPTVLVLLPPSEGKAASPRRGRPVALDELSFPTLTPLRERVLCALTTASARPDAAALLGVGPGAAAEIARNLRLRDAGTRPAHELYTGVLFQALDYPGLGASARRRAASRLVIVSALWGALRPGDRIPPYRLAMDVQLPGIGRLAAAWRPALAAVLPEAAGRGVVIDCRSTSYAAAWTPAAELAARTVAIRVEQEQPSGARTVVSHLAKYTRGEVTRHLLETAPDARRIRDVVAAIGTRWKVDPQPPARPGGTWTLTVVRPPA